MRVTYFGVRGSCPCSSDQHLRYGGNTSCVLVEVDGAPPLILDLGTGLRALGEYLQASSTSEGPVQATALLTHLHVDHVIGLPFFAPMRDRGSLLEVHGPSPAGGSLHDAVAGIVQPPFFPIHMDQFSGTVRFHDLDGHEEITVGPMEITARPVPHIGHTVGYRIEAEGAVVAYVADHQAPPDRRSVDEQVLALCDGADLVVHDAQYSDQEFEKLPDWGHSTVAYAVHVAAEAGARRLALFHHDPAHSDAEIDTMLAQAQHLASGPTSLEVSAASEGTTIELGKAGT